MKNIAYFMERKSIASGDYVIGLEPANSSVYGRPYHERCCGVHRLSPFAREANMLRYTMLDGQAKIDATLSEYGRKFWIKAKP